MSGGARNAMLLAGGALGFAGLAMLSLAILPAPHQPFHYLLAGTLATAVTLAAILALASLHGASSLASHGRAARLGGRQAGPPAVLFAHARHSAYEAMAVTGRCHGREQALNKMRRTSGS